MKSMRVLSARFNDKSGRIEILKEITNDDDTIELAGQSIPPEAFEWRAAEFNLENLDEALELLVYEPHLPSANHGTPGSLRKQQLAELKGKLGSGRRASAQSSQKILRDFGVDQNHIDAAENDPIDVMRKHAHFNQEKIAEKKHYVDSARLGQHVSVIPNNKADKIVPKDNVRELPKIELKRGKRVDHGRV